MKYYVLEIAEGDPKIEGKAVYEYDSLNKALANFHKKIGNARDSKMYKSVLVMVINSNGGIHASEQYTAEESAPEQEEVAAE